MLPCSNSTDIVSQHAAEMFSIMDAGAGSVEGGKIGGSRTCDQCKLRKVKCDMTQPCRQCSDKAFSCTYDRVRKKRGPTGKRIESIWRQQNSPLASGSVRRISGGTPASPSGTSTAYDDLDLTQSVSATSSAVHMLDATEAASQASYSEIGTPLNTALSIDPSLASQPQSLSNITSAPLPAISDQGLPLDSTFPNLAQGDFILPSLPMESPSGSPDIFGNMLSQFNDDVSAPAERWPRTVNEETLLPWIDVYFKRLHPTIPILNRMTMYQEMLERKHYRDNHYGAMLLSLCAFAMTQPVQIHEVVEAPSRTAQARMLMEESIKMRVTADFGEHPTLEMILTSFFLFACLFGESKHAAAWHRLREAVDLAQSLGIDMPQSYDPLDSIIREKWLRTYLVLSVTERAYALQQRRPIGFRGHIGFNTRFRPAPSSANTPDVTGSFAHLLSHEPSDMHAITGLLFLAETFSAFDESVIECWNGRCKLSDGLCESFDRRRALQMFQAQRRAREVCLTGNIINLQSSQQLTLSELAATQLADISITHMWLLNRLWSLCLSHGLLRPTSDNPELCYNFACQIASALWTTCKTLPFAAMEVHGVGLAEKIYDVTLGVLTALRLDGSLNLQTDLTPLVTNSNVSDLPLLDDMGPTDIGTLLQSFSALLHSFRGGDHNYGVLLEAALSTSQEAG